MGNITSSYAKHAKKNPEKIAIQCNDEKFTYSEWYEAVYQTANWINTLSLSNKTVGIFLPNGIPFLQLFAGAATAGWVAVPLDLNWKEDELTKRLNLCQPSVIITSRENYHFVKQLYKHVLVWEDCIKEIHSTRAENIDDTEETVPFYMGFTSGSTGDPKAFIRPHQSWVNSFKVNCYDFHMDEEEHVLIPGSLIHSHFLYGAISTLYLGGTVSLLKKFSPTRVITKLQTESATVVYVVPTMLEAMLTNDISIEKNIKVISSGAKWEEYTRSRIRRMFNRSYLYEFYGASELSFVTVLTDDEAKQKPGSVGKPCHNVKIEIRTAESKKARPNEIGKIFVKSNMVFTGYIMDKNQVIHSIEDENGWITVDDMGYLDESGYLYIIGREKNMILYGGLNIFPEEIETVITSHPGVEAAAVIGLPDSYWGQIVTAVIMGSASKTELRKLCRQKLASYKIPRKWYYMDEIPLTTSGKISRPKVKELLEKR